MSRLHWPSAPVQFAVLAVLVSRADSASGLAWPGLDTIGGEAKIARSTARSALRALVELGIVERAGWHPKDRTMRYRLCLGWKATETAPPAAPAPSTIDLAEIVAQVRAALLPELRREMAGTPGVESAREEPPAAPDSDASAPNSDRFGSFA